MKTASVATHNRPSDLPRAASVLPQIHHTARRVPRRPFLLAAHAVASIILGLLLALMAGTQVHAQTDAEIVQQLSGHAQEVLAAINQHRVNAGLVPLVVDPLLNQAAQGHVNDMLANYNYTHRGSDGSSVKMRVARTGYAADPWVSENWVSSRSVEGAMRWWMNDYIHRVNILTPRWREIGVGIATRPNTGEMIFVTVFSAGRGDPSVQPSVVPASQPAPPPAPLPTVNVPPGGMDYAIRPGDTLLGIAIRHRLDWRVVAAGNGLTERSILQIGQVIRLPGIDAAPAAQFSDDATTGSTAATDDSAQSAAPAPPPTEPYVVESGDTLFSIAARRGITWQELAALNNFREQDYLQIGQTLQVPLRQTNGNDNGSNGNQSANAAAAVPQAEPTQTGTSQVTLASSQPESQLVAMTPSNYVTREHTPLVVAVQPANGANGFVQASATASLPPTQEYSAPQYDEVVVIAASALGPSPEAADAETPAPSAEPATEEQAGGGAYIVQPGDTIISIAIRHNIDWQTLLTINGLTEQSILQPGQEIRLR